MVEAITIVHLVGRLLFGGFFILMGLNHLTKRESMTGYADAMGVPAPGAAVVGSGLLLLVGGVSTLLGLFPRIGLAAVILFLVTVSPKMHAFWKVEDPQQRMAEQTQFLKNMALLGGALMLYALATPWPYALSL